MSTLKPLKIDIVSDVVCPWCYIGKRRIENALALVPDVPVEVRWRPFFLNSWVPREGISRDEYLTAKFGSVEAYKGIAGRVVAAAGEEGLTYRPELVKRQPNTIDCHRLIHWADAQGKSAEMKQRLMELYFAMAAISLTSTCWCRRRPISASMPTTCAGGLPPMRSRDDFGTGAGSLRQGYLWRAHIRVRAEIRGVWRAARRSTRPRHPSGVRRDQRTGGGVAAFFSLAPLLRGLRRAKARS